MNRPSLRRLVLQWGPALLLMTVIFIASAQPKAVVPIYGDWDLLIKKSAHLLGYALLALAYAHGLAGGQRPTTRQFALAFLLAVLYGASDEFHQSFVAGRGAGWQDVVVDGVGAALGLAGRGLASRAHRPAVQPQLDAD